MSTSSTDAPRPPRLEVGRIARPHGLRGEVIVELLTNREERLGEGTVLQASGGEQLVVARASPHLRRFIVSFVGVETREQADRLRGSVLTAEAIADEDAYFVHDLIGCELVEITGRSHGLVASVQANPASDLLVGEQGWLVPLRFVVSRSEGRLVVDAPDGLFE